MGYSEPVRETEYSKTSVHNKAQIAPGHAWIVGEQQERDTLTFLKQAKTEELRDVFRAVAECSGDKQSQFILFHAVNPGDEVQHTNSKLPNLHIHVFTSDFAEEFAHISDPEVKSYVVQPNANLANVIIDTADLRERGLQTLYLNKASGGEIADHKVLVHSGFTDFRIFAERASDREIDTFRRALVTLIEPTVLPGQGGARIIIDDRHTNTGFLTVQVLSGENMDRSGADKQRYFEAPAPSA